MMPLHQGFTPGGRKNDAAFLQPLALWKQTESMGNLSLCPSPQDVRVANLPLMIRDVSANDRAVGNLGLSAHRRPPPCEDEHCTHGQGRI